MKYSAVLAVGLYKLIMIKSKYMKPKLLLILKVVSVFENSQTLQ